MDDDVAQQERSNINCYASAFRYIYIYIYIYIYWSISYSIDTPINLPKWNPKLFEMLLS